MRRSYLPILLGVAGILVIGHFVAKVGPSTLAQSFQTMGWGILLLLTWPIFLYFTKAWAWSYTISSENRRRVTLWRLSVLQTMTHGLGGIQPLGLVAEPVKILMLRSDTYDRVDFTASVLIDHTINAISIFFLLLLGLIYMGTLSSTSSGVRWLILGLAGVLVLLVAFLLFIQRKGVFVGVLGLVGLLPPLRGVADKFRPKAAEADDRVRHFYANSRGAFFKCFAIHLLEKAHGIVEFYLIFYFLGLEVSIFTCFFIFAVVNVLDNLLFFIQLGGMEAYISSLLSAMGLTRDGINITAAIFRRVRILVWAVIALVILYPTRRMLARAPSTPRAAT